MLTSDIHKSLSLCGASGGTLRVYENADGPRASIGQHTCKSAMCPHCAPRITAARFRALEPQIRTFGERGYKVSMFTFTASHSIRDRVADLDALLKAAQADVFSGRAWRAWSGADGELKPGVLKAKETTWSPRAGWHLHYHVTILLPPGVAGDAETLINSWISAVAKAGGVARRSGQHAGPWVPVSSEAGMQAVRYGCRAEWSVVEEAAGGALKNGAGDSLAPFQILDAAIAGDRRAAALWREWVAAMKGSRQLTTSRNIKLRADEELDFDVPVKEIAVLDKRAVLDVESDIRPLFHAAELPASERRAAVERVLRTVNGRWRMIDEIPIPWPETETTVLHAETKKRHIALGIVVSDQRAMKIFGEGRTARELGPLKPVPRNLRLPVLPPGTEFVRAWGGGVTEFYDARREKWVELSEKWSQIRA